MTLQLPGRFSQFSAASVNKAMRLLNLVSPRTFTCGCRYYGRMREGARYQSFNNGYMHYSTSRSQRRLKKLISIYPLYHPRSPTTLGVPDFMYRQFYAVIHLRTFSSSRSSSSSTLAGDSVTAPSTEETNGVDSSNNDVPKSRGSPNPAKERRTLDQVVYHLQADIRRKRRIHKADIHNGVELIEKAGRVDTFGSFLLNCCCDILPDFPPTYRVGLATRIWKVIQSSKEYTQGHFEAMLKALALNEDATYNPVAFLEEAERFGIDPSPTMYFFALAIVCQRGELEEAVTILNRMKDKGVPVSEKIFNVLILGNARNGDLKGAEEILDVMRNSYIVPSPQTWVNLLIAYIEAGQTNKLKKTFSEIIGSGLTEDQFYELLKAAGRQTNADILNLVIEWALVSRKLQIPSIMCITTQLMYLGHVHNAFKMVIRFKDVLRAKKEPLGTFFIKDLHAVDLDSEEYLNIITSMQGDNRNPFALNVAAESCLKHKKLQLVYKVFEGMLVTNIPIRPHYFLPVLLQEIERSGTAGGIHALKQMQVFNVKPDWDMLVNWIVPNFFNEETSMLEVAKIIQEASGLSYSSGVLSATIIVALRNKKLDQAVRLVSKLKGKVTQPEEVLQSLVMYTRELGDESEFKRKLPAISSILRFISQNVPLMDKFDYTGAFVVKLVESNRNLEAVKLYAWIQESEKAVSKMASDIDSERLLGVTDKTNPDAELKYFNGNTILHPNEMGTSDLECHKIELDSKGLNARGVCRKLFLKYCQQGDLEKALETKSTFVLEYGELSVGMKSALMGVYIQNSVVEPAIQIFHELGSDVTASRQIDTFKIIDLAALMVEKGLVAEALQMLDSECASRTVVRPENISRNIIQLLDNLSKASSHDDAVYNLTELFLTLGYIKPTNPSLAPSIKDLIRREKFKEAVARLEEWTRKYRMTPCLQELTYAVLDKPDLLEKVFECSSSTRGVREAKRLLALARSDMGDVEAAAAIFRELGPQLSFTSIVNQCEYLASKNHMAKLSNLIRSIEKTDRNYDCKKLYDIAIRSCKRSGDKEALKTVLSAMADQDMYIPPKLKALI